MELFNNLMFKKLDLSEEFHLKRDYEKEIWNFYCIYSIACGILREEPENVFKKKLLIKKYISNPSMKNYMAIKNHMDYDMIKINNALKKIEEIKQESKFFGDVYRRGMVAVHIDDDTM